MISYFTTHSLSYAGGFNLGGTNASGQARSNMLYCVTPLMAFRIDSYHAEWLWSN